MLRNWRRKRVESTRHFKALANDLKHRGSFLVNGLWFPRVTIVTKNINGKKINITECVEPPTIDIEKEIQRLIIIHQLSKVGTNVP